MTTYLELHNRQWPKRMKILRACVEMEGATSDFLRSIFRLKDTSISFGNTFEALSFGHKLNLMQDLASIDKEDRKRFKLLQEMRNQFAHNDACISYEIYFILSRRVRTNYSNGIPFRTQAIRNSGLRRRSIFGSKTSTGSGERQKA